MGNAHDQILLEQYGIEEEELRRALDYSGMALLRFCHKIVPCTESYFCCYF